MRPRKDIIKESHNTWDSDNPQGAISSQIDIALEVLLDIRQLLMGDSLRIICLTHLNGNCPHKVNGTLTVQEGET